MRIWILAGIILAASLQPALADKLTPASQCAAWRAASDDERLDAAHEAIRAITGKDVRPPLLLNCMIGGFMSCVSGVSTATVRDVAAMCLGLLSGSQ
jgi:hypothetical protein